MTTGSLAHAGAALWGPAGAYLYAAYERLQSRLFPELPPELPMVIGLTAYGHCIGLTRSWPSGARISVAPKVFAEGARMVDDVLVHEMLHVWLMQTGLDHKHAGEPWYPARYYIGPAIAVATY